MKQFVFIKRSFFITLLSLLAAGYDNICLAQTTLYTTNFGTTTAYPTGWTPGSAWSCATTSVSSGYTGASGGSNALFENVTTTLRSLTYSNTLSTVGYGSITVLWGARYLSGGVTFTVALEWSSDGSVWNNVTFTNVTNNSTWALINGGTRIALPAGAAGVANLRLRINATASAGGTNTSYRVDDFSVQGTSCTPPAISQIPSTSIIINYRFNGNANNETGSNNGTLQGSPTLTTNRFGIASSAYTFNGTSQYVSSATSYTNPSNISVSVWFKTTTSTGGMLIGFAQDQTGIGAGRDRHIYMNNAGRIYFGRRNAGSSFAINSTASYNDGNWHNATATMSTTAGTILYVDGVQVAINATWTSSENYTGWWRLGYTELATYPSVPTSFFFNGTLDDALIYHQAITAGEVATLYNSPDGAGGNTPVCAGSSLNLTATTIGGATYAWTGPNSFTSSSQNPTLTYTSAAAGLYTVIVTSGGCSSTAYKNVTTAATSSTISYAGSPYCRNAGTASVTFAGTAGGTYTSTAGLSINAGTGVVTLGTSTAGTYTVTYTVSGGCTATASITVTAVPSATISYAGSPYITSGGTASVTFSGTAGGTYSSTAGLSINATTGDVTLGTSTQATYTVTYTIAASGGCSEYTTTANITITSGTKTWDGGAATNNWGDAANWNTDGVPTSSDNVDLTGAYTININVAATTNNLLLNNASLVLTINSGNSLTVSGNLTLTAGTLNTTNAFPTVTGTVNVAGGTVGFTGSSAQTIPAYSYNNLTVNKSASTGSLGGTTTITGNLTITAGTFDLAAFTINRSVAGGTLTVSNGATLKIGGTNTLPSNYTAHLIGATSTIEYSGTTQSVIVLNSAQDYGHLIISGSGTKTLAGAEAVAGNLTISAGTFDANNNNIAAGGYWINNGGFTAGTGMVTFNGASAQILSGSQALNVFNLITNNSSGITLNANLSVSGAHTFSAGMITTSVTPNYLIYNAGSSYSGETDTRHVIGWVKKSGNTNFTFPVGNASYLREVTISGLSASSEFNAQYSGATTNTSNLQSPLNSINPNEYWTLDKVSGSGTVAVTLNWNNAKVSFPNYVLSDMRTAQYTSGYWTTTGANNVTGTVSSNGTITSDPFSFSGAIPLSIGSTTTIVPLYFLDVSAQRKQDYTIVQWKTAQEQNVKMHEVQRSVTGNNFTTIGQVPARNTINTQLYKYNDSTNLSGTIFYRIKTVDLDEKIKYSKVVSVSVNSLKEEITLLNNPVKDALNLTVNNTSHTVYHYNFTSINGSIIQQGNIEFNGRGNLSISLNSYSPPGSYILVINNGKKLFNWRVIVQ